MANRCCPLHFRERRGDSFLVDIDSPQFREALDETIAYLRGPAAVASIESDPYWPKWDSPWWRALLLVELGQANSVPREIVQALSNSLATHYLHQFPITLREIPADKSPQRHVMCHCGLASIDRILRECGVDVDMEHPWIRPWFKTYQLTDGGWNCDEAAYSSPTPRSSFVSTLPILESLLARGRGLDPSEIEVLDRGANYLIVRRLTRSLSKGGQHASSAWILPCFPRFYEYDLLRGLSFIVRWAEFRQSPIPEDAVAEVVELLIQQAPSDDLATGRRIVDGATTIRQGPVGIWTRGHSASLFPLLEIVSTPGGPNRWLSIEWRETRARFQRLSHQGLILIPTKR